MTGNIRVDIFERYLLRFYSDRLPDALRHVAEMAMKLGPEAKEAVVMLTARFHVADRISSAESARVLVVMGVTLDEKRDTKTREQWTRGARTHAAAM